MSHTIYHVHGIGDAALDGLHAVMARMTVARGRMMKQPPMPIPPLEIPEPPELPMIRGCGLAWLGSSRNATVVNLVATDEDGRTATGSVGQTILRMLHPTEILELTQQAERIADDLEAAADAREAAIDRIVEAALQDADPAIRALAERMSAERRADAERVEWIRKYGSRRLQRMLEEGIEHTATYRDERLALERPEWRYSNDLPGRPDEPRNPPEEALDLLDEARKTVPDARLVYWMAERPCDDCEAGYCAAHDDRYVRGYTCEAWFLGRQIIYRVADDGTPPVPQGSGND